MTLTILYKQQLSMLVVGINSHVASWNTLIAGLIRNRNIDEARQLFNQMPERDACSWSTMISGYIQNEQPNMALEFSVGW